MRLGSYDCKLVKGTKTYDAYNVEDIAERHRHRFEFNNDYRKDLEDKGLVISELVLMTSWWKLLNCQIIHGLSAANSIRNLNQDRIGHIHYSNHF